MFAKCVLIRPKYYYYKCFFDRKYKSHISMASRANVCKDAGGEGEGGVFHVRHAALHLPAPRLPVLPAAT